MISDFLKIQEHLSDGTTLWHAEAIYGDIEVKTALELLNDLSDHNSSFSFTFRDNSCNLNPWFHTAICLEYDSHRIEEVANALYDLPQTVYIVPTISDVDTHLILFPLCEPVPTKMAKRSAAILAQYIEQPGLTAYGEYADYRFRMRSSLPIHMREGITLDAEQMVQNGYGQLTRIKGFYRR